MGCIGIYLPALIGSCRLKKTALVSENYRIQAFSKCSPNETGASSPALLVTACCTAVQSHCTSLPNFAICETADHSQSATARLGYRFVCTTSAFAQKKDANPVGGRGISGFCTRFFSDPLILLNRGRALLQALNTPPLKSTAQAVFEGPMRSRDQL